MSMTSLKSIAEKISKLDPKTLESKFPSKSTYDEYMTLRNSVVNLLNQIDQNCYITDSLSSTIDEVSSALEGFTQKISSKTEIGSKARLNQAVVVAEAGYLERSIHLAGIASEKELKEPYKTQIKVLPSHACLTRYRQTFKVVEWLEKTQLEIPIEVAACLRNMQKSYLYQMKHFADKVYNNCKGEIHPHAYYNKALSNLIFAYVLETQSFEKNKTQVSMLTAEAMRIVGNMSIKAGKNHYMHLNYHIRNYEDFSGFVRLGKKHADFRDRLFSLSKEAILAQKDGRGSAPKEYYDLTKYVVIGARSASVVSILCLCSVALGLDMETVKSGVDSVWNIIASTPGLQNAPTESALMLDAGQFGTGGLANLTDGGNLFALSDYFNDIYAGTGGIA